MVAEVVDLHGVVDDHVRGHQRVDARRVAAHLGHRVAHRGKVDHAGDAGEVLQDHAARHERHLDRLAGIRCPGDQGLDVVFGDEAAPEVAEHVLQQDLDGDGMPRQVGAEGVEAVHAVTRVTYGQRVAGGKRVGNRGQRRHSLRLGIGSALRTRRVPERVHSPRSRARIPQDPSSRHRARAADAVRTAPRSPAARRSPLMGQSTVRDAVRRRPRRRAPADGAPRTPGSCPRTSGPGCRPRRPGCAWPGGRGTSGRG